MTVPTRRRGETREERKRARTAERRKITRDNKNRAGSVAGHDRRLSPLYSVEEDQHVQNGVSGRALASHETNDGMRAVGRFHQGTNSTDDRVLASGEADANRAAGQYHIKRKSIKEEHGGDGFLAKRHYGTADEPDLTTGVRVPLGRLRKGFDADRIAAGFLPELWEMDGNIGFSRVTGALPLARTTGKVGRSRLEGRMNADGLFRDGTMPISVLATKPWPSGEQMQRIYRRLNDLEGDVRQLKRRK